MNADERQIRGLMDDWRRFTMEGNVEAVLGLMTDDAVFLTAGHPPMTKEEFAAASRGFAGRAHIDAKQEVHEIQVSGSLAYAWTHVSVAITAERTAPVERAGHVLTVFRKSPAGRWQLARDANLLVARTPS